MGEQGRGGRGRGSCNLGLINPQQASQGPQPGVGPAELTGHSQPQIFALTPACWPPPTPHPQPCLGAKPAFSESQFCAVLVLGVPRGGAKEP